MTSGGGGTRPGARKQASPACSVRNYRKTKGRIPIRYVPPESLSRTTCCPPTDLNQEAGLHAKPQAISRHRSTPGSSNSIRNASVRPHCEQLSELRSTGFGLSEVRHLSLERDGRVQLHPLIPAAFPARPSLHPVERDRHRSDSDAAPSGQAIQIRKVVIIGVNATQGKWINEKSPWWCSHCVRSKFRFKPPAIDGAGTPAYFESHASRIRLKFGVVPPTSSRIRNHE